MTPHGCEGQGSTSTMKRIRRTTGASYTKMAHGSQRELACGPSRLGYGGGDTKHSCSTTSAYTAAAPGTAATATATTTTTTNTASTARHSRGTDASSGTSSTLKREGQVKDNQFKH
jgi:hypothetical protein